MAPIYKIFLLTGRLFARPVLNAIKKRHRAAPNAPESWPARFFVFLGRREHRFDLYLNRKIVSAEDADMFAKPISHDVAMEKGVEMFYEIMVYTIIIAITVYELNRYSREAREKSAKEADRWAAAARRIEEAEAERRCIAERQAIIDAQVQRLKALAALEAALTRPWKNFQLTKN